MDDNTAKELIYNEVKVIANCLHAIEVNLQYVTDIPSRKCAQDHLDECAVSLTALLDTLGHIPGGRAGTQQNGS